MISLFYGSNNISTILPKQPSSKITLDEGFRYTVENCKISNQPVARLARATNTTNQLPPYTSVAKPENAIERSAAVMKRIGAPFSLLGTGATSTLLLSPASKTKESIKPNALPEA